MKLITSAATTVIEDDKQRGGVLIAWQIKAPFTTELNALLSAMMCAREAFNEQQPEAFESEDHWLDIFGQAVDVDVAVYHALGVLGAFGSTVGREAVAVAALKKAIVFYETRTDAFELEEAKRPLLRLVKS